MGHPDSDHHSTHVFSVDLVCKEELNLMLEMAVVTGLRYTDIKQVK